MGYWKQLSVSQSMKETLQALYNMTNRGHISAGTGVVSWSLICDTQSGKDYLFVASTSVSAKNHWATFARDCITERTKTGQRRARSSEP